MQSNYSALEMLMSAIITMELFSDGGWCVSGHQVRGWMLCLGFSLAYGSLFSKVWTIYRLTTRRKKEVKVGSDAIVLPAIL